MSEQVKKFRKKPVIVEAMEYSTSDDYYDIRDWVQAFGGKCTKQYTLGLLNDIVFGIQTLEGDMLARLGDWIIKGINGEFYPCKSEIFEKTYDEVTNDRA